jgi:protein SCO1/2
MVRSRFLSLLPSAMVVVGLVGGAAGQQSGFDPANSGQSAAFQPAALDAVGIDEHLEAQVPVDLVFTDANGESVRLGELFDGERPVILTMNYASCPQLCGLQLAGFVDTLEGMEDWTPGDQFRVITVSLDPTESAARGRDFRDALLRDYGRREQALSGWSFLRGSEEDIRRLADVVGFRYNFIEEKGEYAHPAALMLLDPQGRVARYLYGIDFKPSTLRLSLSETAASRFVSTIDALILRCFVYDAASGSFVADAWDLTRIVVSVLALILFAFLGWMIRLERKARKEKAA